MRIAKSLTDLIGKTPLLELSIMKQNTLWKRRSLRNWSILIPRAA